MKNKAALYLSIFHILLTIIFYYGFFILGLLHAKPNESNLLNWDAEWFDSIRRSGYQYVPDGMSNLAFFPLFSYLWRFSGLGAIGVSIANLMIFVFSFWRLTKDWDVPKELHWFLCSMPSFIFFAVPYSESLFFLFCVIILIGYRSNNLKLLLLGFFIASLIRSVALLFVPAIIISAILSSRDKTKKHN